MSDEWEGIEFRWERLEDKLRDEYVGMVVHAKMNCDCVICQKAPMKADRRLHLIFVPLDRKVSPQSAWYTYRKRQWSTWGAFCLSLHKLHLTHGATSLKEVIENRVLYNIFGFDYVRVCDFIAKNTGVEEPKGLPESLRTKYTWLPVRAVNVNELEFYLRQDFRDRIDSIDIEEIKKLCLEELEKHFEKHRKLSEERQTEYEVKEW